MQYFPLFVSLILATVPATVLACEGECIVGITNAFLGNYTDPIRMTMEQIVSFKSMLLSPHLPTYHHTIRHRIYPPRYPTNLLPSGLSTTFSLF